MVRNPRRNQLICRMDVFSLLGVQIVLFVIFALAVPTHPHHGTRPELPKAQNAAPLPWAQREDALIVAIPSDGRVYFGVQRIHAPDQLAVRLRERVRNGAEKRVYIKADGRAQYRAVKEVLEQVRLAGIQRVAFLTEPMRRMDSAQ